MEHPEVFYPASKYEEKRSTMQPVYALTAGLTNNAVIKAVRQALDAVDPSVDILPDKLSVRHGFLPYGEAVRMMHFPDSREDYICARNRFAYEEFLVFILSLRLMKDSEARADNHFILEDRPEISRFLSSLPYDLTDAQKKVWRRSGRICRADIRCRAWCREMSDPVRQSSPFSACCLPV